MACVTVVCDGDVDSLSGGFSPKVIPGLYPTGDMCNKGVLYSLSS